MYKNVKIYRDALNFTQGEVQKALKIKSLTTYVNKENGKTDFSITEGMLMAKLFKMTLTQIFEDECSLNIEIAGKKINNL